MDISSLTAFDIGVLLIIGLSTLFAFGKGFAAVALSLGAWFGAFAAVTFGYTFAEPYGQDLISPPELANIITIVALFFISLLVLKQIASLISGVIKNGPVGFLDRSLGALFGLVRGMVIVSLLYFGFVKIFPEKDVTWIEKSQTKPLVAWGADMLEGYAAEALGRDPKQVGSDFLQQAADAVPSQYIEEALEEQAAKYLDENRAELEQLVKQKVEEEKKKRGGP